PACSYLTSNGFTNPTADPTTTTPMAKTWAVINYENTKEVTAEGEKNIAIHNELLPILKQVFGEQVKLKDSMKSMWLDYIFSRTTTRADVEAVQKKYEALGYKIDDSTGGNLWVSKVGQTLHLTFSINSSTIGDVEVLF
ncbi:MAG: hypothetical protein WCX88_02645, partial [Patescibacteria group bacterium]